MRPVERGPDPNPGGWSSWGPAAADALAGRMGWHCAYCEMPLLTGAHVEHIRPKDLHGHLACEWTNWLLACTNCNSTKGVKDPGVDEALWPDRDNTARAFRYGMSGVVSISRDIPDSVSPRAATLRDIVGLDRRPGHPEHRLADRRWQRRLDAYDQAVLARDEIQADPTNDAVRRLSVQLAVQTGFFSVWMSVFDADRDMRLRLISAFGPAPACYDGEGREVPRPHGVC